MFKPKASSRPLVLAIAIAWFTYRRHSAYVSTQERRESEAAQFALEARQDWAASERLRAHARSSSEELAIEVGVGFGLPLLLLFIVEFRSALRMHGKRRNFSS
jgi:hypothetical protein